MELVLFLVGLVGIVHIIVDSEFFRPVRNVVQEISDNGFSSWWNKKSESFSFWKKLNYLLSCYQCSGFWVGMIFGLIFPLSYGMISSAFLVGGATSYLATLAAVLINFLNNYGNKT